MNSSAKTGTKLLLMRSQNTRQGFNITKISDSKVKEIKNQSAGLLSPIKGGLTVTGSSATTNGYKCDYKANGTPIYAPCDGTVYLKQTTAGGTLVSYGNWVDFRSSEGGYRIKMAHLSSLVGIESKKTSIASRRLSSSQVSGVTTATLLTKQVKKGELIGYSGESGNAWGPHLHIEVTKDGKALNPQTAFVSW
ncbi:MAG: M23 family metallopeptidase, partial [Clostridia bacterium]|nr:M23 family metallopeptidase [Clostridia bacterium]